MKNQANKSLKFTCISSELLKQLKKLLSCVYRKRTYDEMKHFLVLLKMLFSENRRTFLNHVSSP